LLADGFFTMAENQTLLLLAAAPALFPITPKSQKLA